jgi:hypothetical protein
MQKMERMSLYCTVFPPSFSKITPPNQNNNADSQYSCSVERLDHPIVNYTVAVDRACKDVPIPKWQPLDGVQEIMAEPMEADHVTFRTSAL